MIVLLKIVAAVVVVAAWDWLAATRLGAYATSFDYRYWPLSRWRLFSVAVLGVTVAAIAAVARPDPVSPPVWPIIVGGAALALWAVVLNRDWFAQRRTAYREPPRSSDRDE